jgi:hypothetical protein
MMGLGKELGAHESRKTEKNNRNDPKEKEGGEEKERKDMRSKLAWTPTQGTHNNKKQVTITKSR